jgi:phage portal protein BeeE
MKLLKTLRNKISSIGRKKSLDSYTQIDIAEGSFLEYALGGGGKITPSQAMELYRNCAPLATSVDKIAEAVEEITPMLYYPGRDEYDSDAEVIRFLRDPNAFETYREFIGKFVRHWLLTHNSHLGSLGGVTRAPLEVYALKPQHITVIPNTVDNYPQTYMVVSGPCSGTYQRKEVKRKMHWYDGGLKEIYPIQGFSSRKDDTAADSPIEAAAREARTTIQGKVHNLMLLKNGARLSMLVNFKDDSGDIDEGQHNLRKQLLNEQWAGADNAGAIGVISGGETNVTEMGISNKDMDYILLEEASAMAIYNRYGIPLPLITKDTATYNNIEQSIFMFYEDTACPVANTLFSGLSKTLLPRFGIDVNEAIITYNPESIPVIMRQKLKEIKERKDINIETPNELRALLPNREPLKEGGDTVYQSSTMVPIGQDPFNITNPTEEGQDDENY